MSMLRAKREVSANPALTVVQRGVCVVALSLLAGMRDADGPGARRRPDRSGYRHASGAGRCRVPLGPPPPGYYRVKPGDTLYRIALENGQNYRDIASWNNMTNPNQIEVDQLLRVAPPGANLAAATPGVSTAPIVGGGVQAQPLSVRYGANGGTPPPPNYGSSSGMGPSSGTAPGLAMNQPPATGIDNGEAAAPPVSPRSSGRRADRFSARSTTRRTRASTLAARLAIRSMRRRMDGLFMPEMVCADTAISSSSSTTQLFLPRTHITAL